MLRILAQNKAQWSRLTPLCVPNKAEQLLQFADGVFGLKKPEDMS